MYNQRDAALEQVLILTRFQTGNIWKSTDFSKDVKCKVKGEILEKCLSIQIGVRLSKSFYMLLT